MSTRILVVTPSYPVPQNPVAAVFVQRQVEALAAGGADCRVFVPVSRPGSVVRRWTSRSWLVGRATDLVRAQPGTVPVHRVPYDRTGVVGEDVIPSMSEALVREAVAVSAQWRAQVVLGHWIWPGGTVALAVGRALGIPVAAMARGGDLNEADWFGAREDCRRHVRATLPELDLPLANCRHLRDRAGEIVPGMERRVRVIYNGCDASWFRPDAAARAAARSAMGLLERDRLLAFCGAVSTLKGVPLLGEAFAALRRRDARWHLVAVGSHPEPATLEGLRRAAGDALILPGRLPAAGVRDVLHAADAYAQPSVTEGLANATLEAMSMGLPVVTTRCGGQEEAIDGRDDGWLVDSGDGPGLLAALVEIAELPEEAARRGAAARAKVLLRFDTARQVRRLRRLLDALVIRGAGNLRR
jgi:glycosyltransferase involved in cell wall biosynthesis